MQTLTNRTKLIFFLLFEFLWKVIITESFRRTVCLFLKRLELLLICWHQREIINVERMFSIVIQEGNSLSLSERWLKIGPWECPQSTCCRAEDKQKRIFISNDRIDWRVTASLIGRTGHPVNVQSMRMIDKFRDREDWRERSRNDFDISMIIIQEDGDWVTCYFQLIPIADFINSR